MSNTAILVVNAGSSSLKLSLYSAELAAERGQPLWQAKVDGRGKYSQTTVESVKEDRQTFTVDARDEDYQAELLESIWSGKHAVLSSATDIKVVGHRVVHGGRAYSESVLVDDEVLTYLHGLIELAPLHERASIRACMLTRRELPGARQVAVFDTAYHHGMPLTSAVYAAPYSWYEKLGIRRYGFHGINHQYCALRACEMLAGRSSARTITCHLGSGASLCATLSGRSVMTTMGYTPLAGLVMRTRCGSIDPGIILHLLHQKRYSVDELLRQLDEESGLKGISGLTGDMREIEAEMAQGNSRAQLAFDIFEQSLAANISALIPTLGGLDVLVFTGGIGENSAQVRAVTCRRLKCLGVAIDEEKNQSADRSDRNVSAEGAAVTTLVIPAREDLAVAQECLQFINHTNPAK
jgi:acetate kinase